MSEAQPYTEEQYSEFSEAVEDHSSNDQVARIRGRLALYRMEHDWTKAVCKMMWIRWQEEHKDDEEMWLD